MWNNLFYIHLCTVNNDTLSLYPNNIIGDRVMTVNQIIGLYDVCMVKRNNFYSDEFPFVSFSWKLESCYINDDGISVAVVKVKIYTDT